MCVLSESVFKLLKVLTHSVRVIVAHFQAGAGGKNCKDNLLSNETLLVPLIVSLFDRGVSLTELIFIEICLLDIINYDNFKELVIC